MFVSIDQAIAVSSLVDKVLALLGKEIEFFHRWEPHRQFSVILEAFPEFEAFPDEAQERIFRDVVHFSRIASFSTH